VNNKIISQFKYMHPTHYQTNDNGHYVCNGGNRSGEMKSIKDKRNMGSLLQKDKTP
jgi:hypothetical protein